MKKLMVLAMLALTSCNPVMTTYSDLKDEGGEVVNLVYAPQWTSSDITLVPIFDMDGDVSFIMVPVSNLHPEVYGVEFRCDDHGKTFTIKSKRFHDCLKVGDKVTLRYVDEIQYRKKTPNDVKVVDQHTKQIVFNDQSIGR